MRRRHFTAALGVLPLAGTAFAQGDDWPQRTVRIVCPFTPGGSQDNIARRLGAKLQDYLGQSFVIDNPQPARAARSPPTTSPSQPPDGYSVLLGGIASHAVRAQPLRQAALQSFHRSSRRWHGSAHQPNMLCCHPELPARHRRQADRRGQDRARQVPVRLLASAPRPPSPWSSSSRRPAPTSP